MLVWLSPETSKDVLGVIYQGNTNDRHDDITL